MKKITLSLASLYVSIAVNATQIAPSLTQESLTQGDLQIRTKTFVETDKSDVSQMTTTLVRIDRPTRFIIELHDEPVFAFKRRLLGENGSTAQNSTNTSALSAHSMQIMATQQQLIQQGKFAGAFERVLRRNSRLHNSIVVESNSPQIEILRSNALVKRIVPVTIMSKQLSESIPLINADDMWTRRDDNELPLTGHGITVAVLDSGIDYTHPDLGGCLGEGCKVSSGYDFVNNDADPMDGDGHGTHVAGIVAANGTLMGVAPDANLMAVKVLSDQGFGGDDGIIAGLEYAVDPDGDPATEDGADIVNMSLGGPGGADSPLSIATNNAVEAGVVVVLAAGNNGGYGDIASSSPTSADKAIAVGSSTKEDSLSGFSSKGGGASSTILKPEIIAPGTNINSTYPGGIHSYLSGTSMASPHVAGAAALLLQSNSALTPQQIKAKLVSGSVDLGLDGLAQGYGRLDVLASEQAEVLLLSADLSLGRIQSEDNTYQYSGRIILENIGNEDVEYQLTMPADLPSAVSIASESDSIVVPAGEQLSIKIEVFVSDLNALATPDNDAAAYFWQIDVAPESPSESIPAFTVPVIIERGYELTISHDNQQVIDVTVDGADGTDYYWDYIFPDESKTFVMPAKQVYVRVQHELSEEDIAHLSLPASDDGIKREYNGYEEYFLTIDKDTELHITTENIIDLTALTSLNESDSDTQAILTAQTLLRSELPYEGDGFTGLITYRSQRWMDSVHPDGLFRVFLVRGTQSDAINSSYSILHKLPATEQRATETYIHLVSNLPQDEDQSVTLAERELPFISLSQSETFGSTAFGAILGSEVFMPSQNISTTQQEIRVSQHLIGDVSDSLVVAIGDKDESISDSFNTFIASDNLYFSEFAHAAAQDANGRLISESETLNFNTFGTTLYKPIEYWNGISIGMLSGDLFRNSQGQRIEKGIGAKYEFRCDEEILSFGDFGLDTQITDGIENCAEVTLSITWDTELAGSQYQSSVDHVFRGQVSPTFPGAQIRIINNGDADTDGIVSGTNAYILIRPDDNTNTMNLDSLNIRFDEEEWQPLDFESTSEGDFLYKADLPARGVSEQVVSLRLQYYKDGLGNSTQTINGAFIYDPDSVANDLDGDGVPDDQDDDIDGDGMPNNFESEHGLDAYNPEDAQLDLDEDGLSNIEEYEAGTDPKNPDSDADGILDGEDTSPLGNTAAVAYDFDGDGKADVAVRRSESFMQYIRNSGDDAIQRIQFGRNKNDIPVTGDFDGDGIADVAVRRPANFMWYIKNSSDGEIQRIQFGRDIADIPVPADYDADGITDIAVRRASNQMWYIKNSSDGEIQRIHFGKQAEDIPVPADYDGDGKADVAVRRASTQMWYIKNSSDGEIQRIHFGKQANDIPVPADYDGDGKADVAVRRASNHMWYIKNSSDGQIQRIYFGKQDADIPIPADYDGDGKVDVAVRRTSNHYQYILRSSDGQIDRIQFGRRDTDIPLAAPISIKMQMR